MPRNSRSPTDFLPLSPLDFQVLALLARSELHGYGIAQEAAGAFPNQPELDIGSLYHIISRMLAGGLIRETPPPSDAPADKRNRRYYTATALGRSVARVEAARLRALLKAPATLELLRDRP
jgi:DNA-binding PadR family transcriptional regulator